MILKEGHSTKDLLAYHGGKIEMGKGIGVLDLDRHIRFKKGEFTIILGHDNVGKTYWTLWYFLCLSTHHDITWTLWLGENKSWSAIRDLIQMYSGKKFKDLTESEIMRYEAIINNWFKFVDNSRLYTPDEMLELFEKSDTDACFIDPFTGLDRGFTHEANYTFLNQVRQFCNRTNKALYMSTHPNSESGRAGRLYPKGHDFEGHLMPPLKDHVEGGKPFSNRVDNFIIVHRLIKHETMKYTTMIDVSKVKDTETGGSVTGFDNPILCDFNSGLGFKVGFDEGIKRTLKPEPVEPKQQMLKANEDFWESTKDLMKEDRNDFLKGDIQPDEEF